MGNFIGKFSVKFKLYSILSFIIVIMSAIGLITYRSMNKVKLDNDHITQVNILNMQFLSDMRAANTDMSLVVASMNGSQVSNEDAEKYKETLDKAYKKFEDASLNYENVPFVEGEEAKWIKVKGQYTEFKDLCNKVLELSIAQKDKERDQLIKEEVDVVRLEFREKITDLFKFQLVEKDKWVKSSHLTHESAVKTLMITTLISLVVLSFVFFMVIRFTLNEVSKLSNFAEALKEGELNSVLPVQSHDELGKLAETFNASMDFIKNAFDAEKVVWSEIGEAKKREIEAQEKVKQALTDAENEKNQALEAMKMAAIEKQNAENANKAAMEDKKKVEELAKIAKEDADALQYKVDQILSVVKAAEMGDLTKEVTFR